MPTVKQDLGDRGEKAVCAHVTCPRCGLPKQLRTLPANPEPPLPPSDQMIAEARDLVDEGWYAICTLVSAQRSSSLKVDGREVQFLHSFFGDPSDYRAHYGPDAA